MRCLNATVALRPKPMAEKMSASSSLYVPESVRGQSQEAVVVKVGPGEVSYGERVSIDLKPDDRVLFLRQGYTATIDGETLYFVTDRDILAVLDDDEVAEFVGTTVDEAFLKEALGKE